MSKVIADISISLDGFVTGPDDGPGQGLGRDGEILHHWVFGRRWTYADVDAPGHPSGEAGGVDEEMLEQAFSEAGACIVGRTMFDVVEGWGYTNPFPIPCFVLTHRIDQQLLDKAPSFSFVGDIHSALEQARAAAGDKHVAIGGGANIIQQYLAAGLVDELQVHIAPVLLGGGKQLFDHLGPGKVVLEQLSVRESPFTTHIRYRVVK